MPQMPHILVTTDLSENSKAGIHFAIDLAQQTGAELIFVHIYQVLRATSWSDVQYQRYIELNKESLSEDFAAFISDVYATAGLSAGNYQTILHHNLDTIDGIIQTAKAYQCSYICISTRGAGMLKKFVGTNTGKLIVNSPIPVLCVPSAWKPTPIKRILYASDMQNHLEELRQVIAFAQPIEAHVDVFHLYLHPELKIDKDITEQQMKTATGYDKIAIHLEQRHIERSITSEIETAVQQHQPDILTMFTKQDRTFFERLFLSSNTEAYSFKTQIPMLTFNK